MIDPETRLANYLSQIDGFDFFPDKENGSIFIGVLDNKKPNNIYVKNSSSPTISYYNGEHAAWESVTFTIIITGSNNYYNDKINVDKVFNFIINKPFDKEKGIILLETSRPFLSDRGAGGLNEYTFELNGKFDL